MSDQLKPCPFEQPNIPHHIKTVMKCRDGWIVECECGARGPWNVSPNMAMLSWNSTNSRPSFVEPSVEDLIDLCLGVLQVTNCGELLRRDELIVEMCCVNIHSHLLAQGGKESVAWEDVIEALSRAREVIADEDDFARDIVGLDDEHVDRVEYLQVIEQIDDVLAALATRKEGV